MRRAAEDRPPYAVLAADPFTKKMAVEPMTLNQGKDWREAVEKIVAKLGKPKVIYSDHDSAMMSNELKGYFARSGIKNIITKQHAKLQKEALCTLKFVLTIS